MKKALKSMIMKEKELILASLKTKITNKLMVLSMLEMTITL